MDTDKVVSRGTESRRSPYKETVSSAVGLMIPENVVSGARPPSRVVGLLFVTEIGSRQ